MFYQLKVVIFMGIHCAPLIADLLFLYYFEKDFMLNLRITKRFYPVDRFNDTSRYPDD